MNILCFIGIPGRARRGGEAGETLVSLIVSIGLASVVFVSILGSFLNSTQQSLDHQTRLRAIEEANAVLDLMAYDLRMLGSGMPLGQGGFKIDDAVLQPESLPVLTDATATHIAFRINETGANTLLTADFNPATASVLTLFSGTDFKTGTRIYMNNATTGGTDGFTATVTSVGGNMIDVANKKYTTAATFRAGSLVDRVSLVTYDSPANNSGITRDAGNGPVQLAPKSSFTLTYLDFSGNVLAAPLVASVIAANLGGVRLVVSVQGDHPLKNNVIYTARAQQTMGFRNLNVSR